MLRARAGPHPVLRWLLQADAAATLGILDESLTGWDALEADLRSAASLAAVADGEGRSATQVQWCIGNTCLLTAELGHGQYCGMHHSLPECSCWCTC